MPTSSENSPSVEHLPQPEAAPSLEGTGSREEILKQVDEAAAETDRAVRDLEFRAAGFEEALLQPEEATASAEIVSEARGLKVQEGKEVAAKVEEANQVSGVIETAPKETAAPALAGDKALEKEMLKAGAEIAKLEAKFSKGKRPPELEEHLEILRKKYEAKRMEYVGDNVERMVNSQEYEIRMRRNFLEKEKGWDAKIYDAYKKLGALNLEKAGWKPTSRVGKIVAKAASVRTLISLGLVAGAGIVGSGTAVGLGAIAVRRALSGLGASIGTYDLMKNASEAKLAAGFSADEVKAMDREDVLDRMEKIEASALAGGRGPSKNEGYRQLKGRLIEILSADQKNRDHGELTEPEEIRQAETELMGKLASTREFNIGLAREEAEEKRRVRKGVAGAVGIFVGSGLLARTFGHATRWLGESTGILKKTAGTAAHEAAMTPPAAAEAKAGLAAAAAENKPAVGMAPDQLAENAHAPNAPESIAPGGEVKLPGEVRAGGVLEEVKMKPDGAIELPPADTQAPVGEKLLAASKHIGSKGGDNAYAKVFKHSLQADPERYHYDPAKDGDLKSWVDKMTHKAAVDLKKIGAGRDARFAVDPTTKEDPQILLDMDKNGNFTLETHGIREYVHVNPAAAAETHVPASSLEPGRFAAPTGTPASVETGGLKVAGYYEETGTHVGGGHIGAPARELGSVVHEFKPGAKVDPAVFREAGIKNVGKGSLDLKTDAALVNKLMTDRSKQLSSLMEAYKQAHFQGQTQLEARLLSDYNAVVNEANGKIGNVFVRMAPIQETGVHGAIAEARAGAGVSPAEHAASAKSLEPEPFHPKVGAHEVKLTDGHEIVDFKGGKLEFLHGKNGELVGVKFAEPVELNAKEIAAAQNMLKDNALEIAREHSKLPPSLISSVMEGRVKTLYAFKKAASEFMKKENLPDAEMRCLLGNIASSEKLLRDSFGEILKKG